MSSAANIARLRWRCRRGTRELDALVGWYLDTRYASASPRLQAAFAALLDQQDPDLWDWLVGRHPTPRVEWQEIVDEIRARDRI